MSGTAVRRDGDPVALRKRAVSQLRLAGCVAAEEEAEELLAFAAARIGAAGALGEELASLVARRARGEPLAWLTGSVRFCGLEVTVHPGVYVPRWQSEPMALEAAERLPERGIALDLCTGSGAIAVVLGAGRPGARVIGCDVDPCAATCARANGVEVIEGDLSSCLPRGLAGGVDVVTAVVPYVPSEELHLLPRDTLAFEPRTALDGGPGGIAVLQLAVTAGAWLLRNGGSLFLELGGDQATALQPALERAGFAPPRVRRDGDGDVRFLASTRERRQPPRPVPPAKAAPSG